jgi:hypothetical protein
VHDGVEIERRGRPAAAIVTHRFVPTAVKMTQIDGMPDYPFLIVPHPLSNLDERELRDRAAAAAPAVARVLLQGEGGEVTL